MSRGRKKTKVVNVITVIVFLLLLIGSIGAVLHFAGIGKDDISDIINPVFRVEYCETAYKSDTNNVISLPNSGQARFEVKGTDGYSVKVAPNVTEETDFIYTVNDKSYSYLAENDLTSVFELQCYENAFVLDMTLDYSIEGVLSRLWGSDNITVREHDNFPLYKFVVTSASGEVIELLFGVGVTSILLPENIVL